MTKKINLIKFIKPIKVENTNPDGAINPDFSTTDFIRIRSHEDLRRLSVSEKIKSATDFAVANGVEQDKSIRTFANKSATQYMLRSTYGTSGLIDTVSAKGYNALSEKYSNGYAICPVLNLDIEMFLQEYETDDSYFQIEHKLIDNKDVHIIKLGEYPQKKVEGILSNKLEGMFAEVNPNLVNTGNFYTIHRNYISEQNGCTTLQIPEFEYMGTKYVRFVKQNLSTSSNYSDNSTAQLYSPVWIKVEEIPFQITNWNSLPKSINPKGLGTADSIELESVEGLLSSLQFFPISDNNPKACLWQNSLIRAFLNSAKTFELDGNINYSLPAGWDFSKTGFLQQALNLEKTPITEYTIPDHETEIGDSSFVGCLKLKKIIIPAHVKECNSTTFKNLANDIQFQVEYNKKYSPFLENVFENSAIKYVYLPADKKHVIFSKVIQPELEEKYERHGFQKGFVEVYIRNNEHYTKNMQTAKLLKEKGEIKFIPPKYVLQIFPNSQLENFFNYGNDKRWASLVKESGFLSLTGIKKEQALESLLKVYYAIGGFAKDNSTRDIAYKYMVENIFKAQENKEQMAESFIRDFSKFQLNGPHNSAFAQLFMKNYHVNPAFLLYFRKNYLAMAHNMFDTITKVYPNRVVGGNEERGLLSPSFICAYCHRQSRPERGYENILPGNEFLAQMSLVYGYSEFEFEEIQTAFETAKQLKNSFVIIADKCALKEPVQFRLLEKDDEVGFFLGEITNCCQKMGGAAESCVIDGYKNENAGFLVFEESLLDKNGNITSEKRILGQAFVWYDKKTKTVCYDNIEIPSVIMEELERGDRQNKKLSVENFMKAVEQSAESIIMAMNRKGIPVERVTTGEGFTKLINYLKERYELEENPKARNRNIEYSDAKTGQFIIRKYADITKTCSENISETITNAKLDIQKIELAINNEKSPS